MKEKLSLNVTLLVSLIRTHTYLSRLFSAKLGRSRKQEIIYSLSAIGSLKLIYCFGEERTKWAIHVGRQIRQNAAALIAIQLSCLPANDIDIYTDDIHIGIDDRNDSDN